MANIRVTLELDDQGYITKLKLAEAETAKLGKTAATAGAQGATGVGLLSGAMVGLRAAATAAMTAMAPLLAAAAAFSAIKGAFTLADDITDLAQGSGVAADKIIALRQALQKAGGDADSAGMMITKLTNFLDNAASGSAEAVNKLAELGISMQDIRTMSPEQALDATIAALAKMEDPIKRNALAFDLLGKRAANINWKEVQAGTAETTAEQKAQAAAAAKLAEVYDSVGAAFTNIQLAIVELLAPFADLYDRLSKLNGIGSVFKVVFKGVQILFAALAVTAYTLYTAINTVIEGLEALFNAAILAVRGNLGGAGYVLSKFASDTKDNFADVIDFAEEQFGKLRGVVPKADEGGTPGGTTTRGGGRAVADPLAKERAKVEGISDAYKDINKEIREKLQLEYDSLGVSEEEVKVADARREAQAKANEEIRKLNDQLAGLDMTKATDRSLAGTIRAEIAEIEGLVKAEQDATEATIRSGEKRKRSYVETGLEFQKVYDIDSFVRNLNMMRELENATTEEQKERIKLRYAAEEQYQKDLLALKIKYGDQIPAIEAAQVEEAQRRRKEVLASQTGELDKEEERKRKPEYVVGQFVKNLEKMTDPLIVLENSLNSVFGNMTQALDNFVETGKFKFGDFTRSVIQDLIKIQMKALAVGIFKSILGSFGLTIPTAPGRAFGGPVLAGSPYIVGEKGPELFVPTMNGKIVANSDLKPPSGSGGMDRPTQVVYNIQAVDAPSFQALVARDPQFIYSVTQLGSRSVPR